MCKFDPANCGHITVISDHQSISQPVSVAARSMAWVCGSSLAETVGSNPTGAWMSVCCEFCVLSGRCLCDGLMTHPEESYRLRCVVGCDLETLLMRRPWPTGGLSHPKQTNEQRIQ
jgi:hypothetical protein